MIKQFFRDSIFYTIATVFTRGINLLLLPLYTRYLTKEEFGYYDYIFTTKSIIGVIIALEVQQALFRFIPEHKGNIREQSKIISTGFWFSIACHSLFSILIILNSEAIAHHWLGNKNLSDSVIYSNLLLISSAIFYNSTIYLRALLNSKKALIATAISAASIFVTSFILLSLGLGLKGVLIAHILGSALAAALSHLWIRQYLSFELCLQTLKKLLNFSIPLVASSLGVMLALYIDRIMVKEMIGTEALANYSVAARVAGIITLVMIGFQSALTPLIYTHYKKVTTPVDIAKIFHYFIVFTLIGLIGITILSESIIILLAGSSYLDSKYYVPVLTTAAIASSIHLFFPGLNLRNKTILIAFINILGGLGNILLNYLLIPIYGEMGASYSSLLSILITACISATTSYRFYRTPINLKLILLVTTGFILTLYFSNILLDLLNN